MGRRRTKYIELENRWTAQQTERRNLLASKLFQKITLDKARLEVMAELGLSTYSLSTVAKDKEALLDEWRNKRLNYTDDAVGAEIAEIEYTQSRLWKRINERAGKHKKMHTEGKACGSNIQPVAGYMEEQDDANEIRYIHEINELAKEKRKLLGLYAPEKRELSGSISFAEAMMDAAAAVKKQAAEGGNGNTMQDLAADGKPIDWDSI